MTKLIRLASLTINLAAGCVLFLLSPGFRSIVRAKMKTGPDDTVSQGEQVVAVLTNDNGKEFIGG